MSKKLTRVLLALPMLFTAMAPAVAQADPDPMEMSEIRFSWDFASTGVPSLLFGVDVVDKNVIWASGQGNAVVVRTIDGGRSWQNVTRRPIVDTMIFQDVEAFGRDRALVLQASNEDASKILRTDDGGAEWDVVFKDRVENFYDGIAFFSSRRGLSLGDPVGDKFRIAKSTTGGRTWTLARTDRMPNAEANEAAHATGTSLVTIGPRDAWFGTVRTGSSPRVFHTRDGGRSWTAATVPILVESDLEFGVVSLVFWDRRNGMAVGGGVRPGIGAPEKPSVAAVTHDGGRTWKPAGQLSGFRFNAVRIPHTAKTAVAVGPSGSDVTTDGGRTWHRFDETNLLGISCAPDGTCWAVGENGVAARLVKRRS